MLIFRDYQVTAADSSEFDDSPPRDRLRAGNEINEMAKLAFRDDFSARRLEDKGSFDTGFPECANDRILQRPGRRCSLSN